MKKAIAAVLILTFVIVCFSGCGGSQLNSGSESIGSFAGMKSHEAKSTITLNLDVSMISWLNSPAHRILTSMTSAPFTMTTKVVNNGDMAGKVLIGVVTADLNLECYYEYDFRDSDDLKFRIVIPTKNFESYFGVKPEKEYIWIDAAKSQALSRYLPILSEVHKEYKILKYPNLFYPALLRGEWLTDGGTYKLTVSEDFLKKQFNEITKEAFENPDFCEKMRNVYNLGSNREVKDIKITFYTKAEPIIMTRYIAEEGVNYEIANTSNGRRVDTIKSEGSYYVNMGRIVSAFASNEPLPDEYVPVSIKTETKFTKSAKINGKYKMTDKNSVDATAAVDDFFGSLKRGRPVKDPVTIIYNGKKIDFPVGSKPFFWGEILVVPAQILATEIGATVEENAEQTSLTIGKSGTLLTVKEYETKATVNGMEVDMIAWTSHVNGVYFVPLGIIADTFGIESTSTTNGDNITINLSK